MQRSRLRIAGTPDVQSNSTPGTKQVLTTLTQLHTDSPVHGFIWSMMRIYSAWSRIQKSPTLPISESLFNHYCLL